MAVTNQDRDEEIALRGGKGRGGGRGRGREGRGRERGEEGEGRGRGRGGGEGEEVEEREGDKVTSTAHLEYFNALETQSVIPTSSCTCMYM